MGTLGRIINVIGEPIDERGPIHTDFYASIYADAPELTDTVGSAEILETGIKVVDLIAPYSKGGKIGLFGFAGVGERTRDGNDLYHEMIEGGVINITGGDSKVALVYGQMNEPPGARARVALTGLTVAEYFRDQ